MSTITDFDRQHVGQILEDPARYDWLACHILRLVAKAHGPDRELLRTVYPDHVAAYEQWFASDGRCEPPLPAPASQLHAVAASIVRHLFTSGSGAVAERLVLVAPGESRNLGGWGPGPVRDHVLAILKEAYA